MAQKRRGKREISNQSPNHFPRNLLITLVCACMVAAALIAISKHFFPEGESGTMPDTSPVVTDNQVADSSTGSEVEADVDTQLPEESAESEESPEPEVTTVTVSCVGDCTLGTDENFNASTSLPAMAEEKGLDYFLSNVKDIFSADDLTIVNFEGTLTTSTARADKTYAFKGDPSYTEILTSSSVEACNLANNHSHDYGSDSYTDTKTYLEEAGLLTFGYDNVAITQVNGVRVALVGVYELAKGEGCLEDLESAMSTAKDENADLIIVSFHWGIERDETPDATQIKLAHAAVDLGANLVVGHHPHVLQGIEEYNGVNILYSLGNFCFGGNSNPSDKDTMIYQQTFTFVDGELQLGIEDNIIPCSLSSVSSRNDYCPTPATGDEAQRILDKIETRSKAIGS
jgi:poly-gamma-glutamate synthesis protein (capsule biosynthesis protein)